MRNLNYALIAAAGAIALLVLVNSIIGRQNTDISSRLSQAQQLASSAPNNKALLRALANRVNQAAAQDAELKAVLQRQGITVSPEANAATPAR